MITIQKVSEALHEIETSVFKDLEINPFQKTYEELEDEVMDYYQNEWISGSDLKKTKEKSIKLAALLTRLISELP